MGRIMLNNVEYSGGSSSIASEPVIITEAEYLALGDKVLTDNVVYYIKDSVESMVTLVNTLDNTVTDEQIPSAKAVYDKLQSIDAKTLEGLTVKELTANSVKNLIPYPYYHTTRTENGIEWVDSGNASIIANGTATAETAFRITPLNSMDDSLYLPNGKYTISDINIANYESGCWIAVVENNSGTRIPVCQIKPKEISNTFEVTDSENCRYEVYIGITNGAVIENYTFKPMLEVGSIAHDYVPYNNSGVVNNQIEILENGDETLPRTIVTTTNGGTSYFVNRDENDVRRQLSILPVENRADVNESLVYETNESGEWVGHTVLHSGNIANYAVTKNDKNVYSTSREEFAIATTETEITKDGLLYAVISATGGSGANSSVIIYVNGIPRWGVTAPIGESRNMSNTLEVVAGDKVYYSTYNSGTVDTCYIYPKK